MRLHSAAVFVVLAARLALISSQLIDVIPGQITVTPPPAGTCQLLQEPYCTFEFEPPDSMNGFTRSTAYFPNFRGQRTFEEALPEFNDFIPLLQSGCSDQIGVLLCFYYFPLCRYDVGNKITDRPTVRRMEPCRDVCEEARRDCEPLMVSRGFPWPEHLNCDNFARHNESDPRFPCINDGSMAPYPTLPPVTREPDPCEGFAAGSTMLICAPDCGSPPSLEHGSVEYSTITVGSQATYECSVGYTLKGDSLLTCKDFGMWSGERPTCEKNCDRPSAPRPGGTVVYDSLSPGSQASFQCDRDYHLVGDRYLTCVNGEWVGDQPTCQKCRLRTKCTSKTFRVNDYTFAIHVRLHEIHRADEERNTTFTVYVEKDYLNLGGGPSRVNTTMPTTDCCGVCDGMLDLEVGNEYLFAGYFVGSQWYLDTQDSLVSPWNSKYQKKLSGWIQRRDSSR